MIEIDRITVKGFKSIASIEELKLGAINLMIGPNGSGKSNFLGVFSFLHAIREGRLQDYVIKSGGANKVLHFGSRTTPKIETQIVFGTGEFGYAIELTPAGVDRLYPSLEQLCFFKPAGPAFGALATRGPEAAISAGDREAEPAAQFVKSHLDRWRLYHFHDTSVSSPMKKTAALNDNRFLRHDGANLAAFLYFLQSKRKASYELIRSTIQRTAPFFDDFVLEPLKLNPKTIQLEWRHKSSEAYFDASSLSDGTLRFIALATLLLQPDDYLPSLIMVDEPELGLHPYAITLLSSMIERASARTQLLLSTQSPALLDHFQPENVLVAERINGGTQLRRLDAEKLNVWLEDYSLGQLWEKNEIGGRPGGE